MTALKKSDVLISPEEYLEGELLAEVRHEYVAGQVFAMAGASDDHNRIAGSIFGILYAQLRGKPCEAFMNDMKARVATAFYYPDVMVVCDPTDNHRYFRERPSVVFEVLSPDTERTDRREKSISYWHRPTCQSYIVVAQDRVALTVMRRGSGDWWESEEITDRSATLRLPEIGCEISVAEIYERTSV